MLCTALDTDASLQKAVLLLRGFVVFGTFTFGDVYAPVWYLCSEGFLCVDVQVATHTPVVGDQCGKQMEHCLGHGMVSLRCPFAMGRVSVLEVVRSTSGVWLEWLVGMLQRVLFRTGQLWSVRRMWTRRPWFALSASLSSERCVW